MKSNYEAFDPVAQLSLFLLMQFAASNSSRRNSPSSDVSHLILEAKAIQHAVDSVLNELIGSSIEVLFLDPVYFGIR